MKKIISFFILLTISICAQNLEIEQYLSKQESLNKYYLEAYKFKDLAKDIKIKFNYDLIKPKLDDSIIMFDLVKYIKQDSILYILIKEYANDDGQILVFNI